MTSLNQQVLNVLKAPPVVDEKHLAVVQDVINTVVKTLKVFRTYPRENTISITAVDSLAKTFEDYFKEHETLEIFVERHELQYQGVPVYSETDQRKSLAMKLDRDGVRRVVFHRGIDRAEVLQLLDALSTEIDEESLDDDLVTLLWERQLAHVKLYVLDQANEDTFDPALVEAAQSAEGDSVSSSAAPGIEEEGSLDPSVQAAICAAAKAKLHPVTDQQAAELRDNAEQESHNDVSGDLKDILLDILQTETGEQLRVNALKVLVELVMMYGRSTQFGKAADILGKLRALAADERLNQDLRAMMTERLLSMGEEARMKVIVETLKDHQDVNLADLGRFLLMLPSDAAPQLCELMEISRYDDVTRTALKHLVKDNPEVLIAKLAGPNAELAKKILCILDQVADAELAPSLVDPLTAAEEPVKIESVKLLTRLQGPSSRQLLLSYVAGENPELRKAALRGLASFADAAGPATALRQQATLKDFDGRTLEEKKALLVTLARFEREHALEFLQQLIDFRRWFEKTHRAETRACAALALGEIDSDAARAVLEKHASDKSEVVRTAVRLVLSRRPETARAVGS